MNNHKFKIMTLAAVLASGIFMSTPAFAAEYIEVKMGSEVLGHLESNEESLKILEDIKKSAGNTQVSTQTIEAEDLPVSTKEEVLDKIQEQLSKVNEYGVLKIDGKVVAQLNTMAEAEEVIERIKAPYHSEDVEVLDSKFNFEPKLEVEPSKLELTESMSADEAYNLLMNGGVQDALHIVSEEDTQDSIAELYHMDPKELKSLNKENLYMIPGKPVKVHLSAPMLKAQSTEMVQYNEDIPFETVEKEDPNLYIGERKVERAGKNGAYRVTAERVKENAQVVSQVKQKVEVIEEPQQEIVLVGTRERAATGSFINPTSGRLTSRFGPRWGRMHMGIDVAGPVGTPIHAADGGVVIKAGPAGSYGNLVIIDHQNGYTTRYAHNSSINVQVGQTVAQGELICKMGSTGRSTGPHLHFEVRQQGQALNPLNFVNY